MPHSLVTDGEKVASEDLATLYSQHADSIKRYVYKRFGSGPPDPEDVVQAVFTKYAAQEHGNHIINSQSFLIRTAHNYVIDQHRRIAVSAAFVRDEEYRQGKSDDFDAERVLVSRERLAMIDKAVAALDARSRNMLLMNRVHGQSYAEIARQFQCSATLVKMIVAKALVACHNALPDDDA